jgi:hypothetical protein
VDDPLAERDLRDAASLDLLKEFRKGDCRWHR